jgi:hypothetical protein
LQPGFVRRMALAERHESRQRVVEEFEQHLQADDWSEAEWEGFFRSNKCIVWPKPDVPISVGGPGAATLRGHDGRGNGWSTRRLPAGYRGGRALHRSAASSGPTWTLCWSPARQPQKQSRPLDKATGP